MNRQIVANSDEVKPTFRTLSGFKFARSLEQEFRVRIQLGYCLLAARRPQMCKAPFAPVVNSVVSLLGKARSDGGWRFPKMFVGEAKLKGRLDEIHPSGAGTQTRTSQTLNLSQLAAIVAMHRCEHGPHREINVIRSLDVHRDAHGRRVRHKRMRVISGRDNEASAHRLLTQVVVDNLFLDAFHHGSSEVAHNGEVHACVHQTE